MSDVIEVSNEKKVSTGVTKDAFAIVPVFKEKPNVIKNSGGNFPYISVCLGVGANLLFYGAPGDQWSFACCNGIINFSSPNPIYQADPKDMSDLADNYPGLYSKFYEGGDMDYNQLDCVLKCSRQLLTAENKSSVTGVCYGAIHPQIFQPLLVGLRNFSKSVNCPIEIWCIPEEALANVFRVATKLMEDAIIKHNIGMTQEYFFMVCLRMIVLMVFRDDAGRWCMKDNAGQIINQDVLSTTALFQDTKEIAFNAETSYKVNELTKMKFFKQHDYKDDSVKLLSHQVPLNQEGWPEKNSGVILDNINQ